MAKRRRSTQPTKKPSKQLAAATTETTTGRGRGWIVAVILAVSIAVVYGRSIHAPLIFDDDISLIKNTSIRSLWPLRGTTEQPGPLRPGPDQPTSARPLVNLTFALNYRFGGLDPAGYRVVNLLIHFACAMLLWATVRRTLRLPYFDHRYDTSADWLALAVATLWTLHPLQTETVAYISQRTELMVSSFYLATIYCSLRYWEADLIGEKVTGQTSNEETAPPRPARVLWLGLAAVACLAGMASKEIMVSAPLIVLFFERTFVAGSIKRALRRSWPLYVALCSTLILLYALTINNPRSNSAGFGLGVPVLTWWMTQSKVLLLYLKLVIWPWPLLIHYELPYLTSLADAWMYVIPVTLLACTTLVLLWRNRPVGFLLTLMFAILSPTLLVPILTEMAAERRMYLPLAALLVVFCVGGFRFARSLGDRREAAAKRPTESDSKNAVFLGVVCLLAVVWGLISIVRVKAYDNELELWQGVLQYQPRNVIALQNAGLELVKAGDTAGALEHFREAVRIEPKSAEVQHGLGVLLSKSGAHAEAAEHFAAAAKLRPNDARTLLNLSATLYMVGRYEDSARASRAALELDRNNWSAYNNLGSALQKSGKYAEAIENFRHALRLNSNALFIYDDLADTYVLSDRPSDAMAAIEEGLRASQAASDAESSERFSARLQSMRKP
jgi:Flp pilus assembly protein TadD